MRCGTTVRLFCECWSNKPSVDVSTITILWNIIIFNSSVIERPFVFIQSFTKQANMRSFPIQQSTYNRTKKQREYDTRVSTEWDISMMIRDDSHLQQIVSDSSEACSNDDIVYLLIGGLERAERGDKHAKIGTGEHQFHDHVHAALIVKQPITRAQALEHFGWTLKHGCYAVPRNKTWPYLTWKFHHTKPQTKLNANYKLFEHGTLPSDDITNKPVVDKLIKFGKQFASATEWKQLLEQLDIQRTIVQQERNAEKAATKQLKLTKATNERKRKREETQQTQQTKPKRQYWIHRSGKKA